MREWEAASWWAHIYIHMYAVTQRLGSLVSTQQQRLVSNLKKWYFKLLTSFTFSYAVAKQAFYHLPLVLNPIGLENTSILFPEFFLFPCFWNPVFQRSLSLLTLLFGRDHRDARICPQSLTPAFELCFMHAGRMSSTLVPQHPTGWGPPCRLSRGPSFSMRICLKQASRAPHFALRHSASVVVLWNVASRRLLSHPTLTLHVATISGPTALLASAMAPLTWIPLLRVIHFPMRINLRLMACYL
jgi:hypothetical protein